MPDITMCLREECPKAQDCYRFMATPDPVQSYASFKPKGDQCEYFVPLKNNEPQPE